MNTVNEQETTAVIDENTSDAGRKAKPIGAPNLMAALRASMDKARARRAGTPTEPDERTEPPGEPPADLPPDVVRC